MSAEIHIEKLESDRATTLKPQLIGLLSHIVDGGSSVGFLRPLSLHLCTQYWTDVIDAVAADQKILLVALLGDQVVGSVQAEPCSKHNGRHRAEIQKLMVLNTHRKRGIARKLMQAIEQSVINSGYSTLYLDTVTGSPAEQAYLQLGWTRSGSIPNYAVSPDGEMESTTVFYKLLNQISERAA